MARKRRTTSRKKSSRKVTIDLKSSVMREIWAVTYFAFGVCTYLSINNGFGLVGEVLMSFLRPVLGWGINILPILFIGAAVALLFSKKVVFPASRIIGITFLFVSGLSILHLSVPMESLYSEAQAGNYGGYIGFVMNFLFRELLNVGHLGASAIYFTMLIIGTLLTFEISLRQVMAFMKPDIKIIRKKVAARGRAVEEQEIEEEERDERNDEAEEILDEEEEDEISEEDFERERNKARQSDADLEVLTIKRPEIQVAADKTKERKIKIIEEDEKPVQALESDGDTYVWAPPSLDLLDPPVGDVAQDDALLKDNAKKIRDKLHQFGIDVEMHEVHVGPTVIQYTLRPHEGIKLSKITGLKSDLALALAAKAIRIEAPIPGKSLVGIEVPNDHRSIVHLRELLESKEFSEIKSNLRLPLGRDVAGKPVCGDLASMPHLLVAGATGSGKSVGMNSFLLSLVYQNSPSDLRFIMIDPKRVELSTYNGIPHLLTPVITDPEKAAIALRWAVAEMNRRYQLCAETGHRNIQEFNTWAEEEKVRIEAEMAEKADKEPVEGEEVVPPPKIHQKMPNIVVVIDELADLMMAAGKEVEASICRIAQMARAVGMHLIIATQRPSVDVITGLIKANVPTRIAFAVSSGIDSRTILDGSGAEDLLGKGDMLYLPGGMSRPLRVQGIYVSSKEIERVNTNIKIQAPANYVEDIISPKVAQQKVQGIPESDLGEMDDEDLYQQAINVIAESRKASASLLQRRLKVGYARAARMLDLMEENGLIGPVNGAKAREIYID
jgi:S-DNA-T family DNA segregation ATPase FtsK/SpoIIIE